VTSRLLRVRIDRRTPGTTARRRRRGPRPPRLTRSPAGMISVASESESAARAAVASPIHATTPASTSELTAWAKSEPLARAAVTSTTRSLTHGPMARAAVSAPAGLSRDRIAYSLEAAISEGEPPVGAATALLTHTSARRGRRTVSQPPPTNASPRRGPRPPCPLYRSHIPNWPVSRRRARRRCGPRPPRPLDHSPIPLRH
jgi:hypothetical protein